MIAANGYQVGIRSDSRDVLDRLQSMFGEHAVDAEGPDDDFSISVGRQLRGSARLQPHLLHGNCKLLVSRSIDRLLHRLDLTLGVLDIEPGPGIVRVGGLGAIVRAGAAVMVPTSVIEHSGAMEREIVASGGRIAEEVGTYLDVRTGEVVVVPGLSELGSTALVGNGISATSGRYALRRVFWPPEDIGENERRASGVVRMMQRLSDLADLEPQQLLEAVTALSTRFEREGLARNVRGIGRALAAVG